MDPARAVGTPHFELAFLDADWNPAVAAKAPAPTPPSPAATPEGESPLSAMSRWISLLTPKMKVTTMGVHTDALGLFDDGAEQQAAVFTLAAVNLALRILRKEDNGGGGTRVVHGTFHGCDRLYVDCANRSVFDGMMAWALRYTLTAQDGLRDLHLITGAPKGSRAWVCGHYNPQIGAMATWCNAWFSKHLGLTSPVYSERGIMISPAARRIATRHPAMLRAEKTAEEIAALSPGEKKNYHSMLRMRLMRQRRREAALADVVDSDSEDNDADSDVFEEPDPAPTRLGKRSRAAAEATMETPPSAFGQLPSEPILPPALLPGLDEEYAEWSAAWDEFAHQLPMSFEEPTWLPEVPDITMLPPPLPPLPWEEDGAI